MIITMFEVIAEQKNLRLEPKITATGVQGNSRVQGNNSFSLQGDKGCSWVRVAEVSQSGVILCSTTEMTAAMWCSAGASWGAEALHCAVGAGGASRGAMTSHLSCSSRVLCSPRVAVWQEAPELEMTRVTWFWDCLLPQKTKYRAVKRTEMGEAIGRWRELKNYLGGGPMACFEKDHQLTTYRIQLITAWRVAVTKWCDKWHFVLWQQCLVMEILIPTVIISQKLPVVNCNKKFSFSTKSEISWSQY